MNEEDEVDTLASPPGHRKNILDSLRPRSKSDAYASYKQKKSSFLNQLKIKKASRNVGVSILYTSLLDNYTRYFHFREIYLIDL